MVLTLLGSTGDVLQSYESGYADVIHAAVNAFRSEGTRGQARCRARECGMCSSVLVVADALNYVSYGWADGFHDDWVNREGAQLSSIPHYWALQPVNSSIAQGSRPVELPR